MGRDDIDTQGLRETAYGLRHLLLDADADAVEKAADTIDALRANNARLRDPGDNGLAFLLGRERDDARAEVARLRAENAVIESSEKRLSEENERLRATWDEAERHVVLVGSERDEARAEVARLRDAMTGAVSLYRNGGSVFDAIERIDAALGEGT